MDLNLSSFDYFFAIIVALCIVALYIRSRRISISYIPGPKAKSFLLGNLPEHFQTEAGDLDIKWQEQFGPVYRIKGAFGEDRLVTADPKAIQHVLGDSDIFRRPMRGILKLMLGPGVVWAEGDDHKRQRRVMSPAFSVGVLKSFIPVFFQTGQAMTAHWKDLIEQKEKKSSMIINVAPWLSRATLDALGNAAFDYNFNALDEDDNELAKAYHGLFLATDSQPTNAFLFFREFIFRLPEFIALLIFKHLPTKGRKKVRNAFNTSSRYAKSLVGSKLAAYHAGEVGSKDLLSLLVKSNVSSNEATRMKDDELLAQMVTMVLAGHDTTANSVTWALYALSQNPEVQSKARAEIMEVKSKALERGLTQLTYTEYEAMPYLTAVMKEVLRVHSVAFEVLREAAVDTVLPLSKAIMTLSGKTISEIPIGKGQVIHIAVNAYNYSKEIWGDDALLFKPERWLNGGPERKGSQVGMVANLTGPKGCIGWRFSMIEMQAFLIELLSTFEFSIPANAKPIRRELSGAILPIIEDEREKGAQMPLEVKVIE